MLQCDISRLLQKPLKEFSMFDDLGPAMRRALAATRATNLTEATRVIQEALRGAPGQDAPPSDTKPSRPARPRKSLGDTLSALRKGADVAELRPIRQPDMPEGSAFLKRSIRTTAGNRDYRLYVPTSAKPRGLVVMLHGCKQNAEDFATGTTMNLVAEAEHMMVAYPAQTHQANPSQCWNWFRPEDQSRDGGEPHIIAELTRAVMAEYGITRQVFVAGLSAGGAMAAVMAATYPELFEAAGIHSGLPYRSAHDVSSALGAMRGDLRMSKQRGSSSGFSRQIVFHGSRDHTVVPGNAEALMEAAAAAHGKTEKFERQFTTGSRRVAHTELLGTEGIPVVETWLIDGAGHYWIGGNPKGSYAKPEGPSASREMMRFFLGRRLQTA